MRKRFSVEQITGILKQAELGTPIADLLRQHGVAAPVSSEIPGADRGQPKAPVSVHGHR